MGMILNSQAQSARGDRSTTLKRLLLGDAKPNERHLYQTSPTSQKFVIIMRDAMYIQVSLAHDSAHLLPAAHETHTSLRRTCAT